MPSTVFMLATQIAEAALNHCSGVAVAGMRGLRWKRGVHAAESLAGQVWLQRC